MASLRSGAGAAATASSAEARGRAPAAWVVIALIGLTLAAEYFYALSVPFINDDYIFLEKTRDASFASLWGLRDLMFHWYRPWSRELHYWTLRRVLGYWEPGYHLVSGVLWLAVMSAYFALARRLAGPRVAILATAGAALMAAWSVPILWIAGAQELWFLLFALLMLHAFARGSIVGSALALVLALLSKETAAALPAVALLFALVLQRRPVRDALARTAVLWLIAGVWAAFHPMLGGRLRHPIADAAPAGLHPPVWTIAIKTLLALVNLDTLPKPTGGPVFLARAIPAMVIAAALALWAGRGRPPAREAAPSRKSAREPASASAPDSAHEPISSRAVAIFGAGWALLGWAPLASPSLGWHSYYALFGALGAWLALATGLARRPPVFATAALIACALLRSALADTPSFDWGSEWYQRRAGSFIRFMRDDLRRKRPRLAPHSRLFFTMVPNNVGFMTRGAPALRVWYRDPTLSGGFYGDYRARYPEEPQGPDYFFRYDTTAGWVEIEGDRESAAAARARNPQWEKDQRELASAMARSLDWTGTARQYQKLVAVHPESAEYVLNVGVCYEMLRDSANAERWYRRAAATEGASEDVKRFANQFKQRFGLGR